MKHFTSKVWQVKAALTGMVDSIPTEGQFDNVNIFGQRVSRADAIRRLQDLAIYATRAARRMAQQDSPR